MGPIYSLADFLDLVRRRFRIILVVFLIGCVASLFVALSSPQVYQSTEVIQIEGPKISDDLARSTVEGSAARRLQLIEQQLMARNNLERMIDEFGIFENLPSLRPVEKVALLRQAVSITGVAAVREGFADDGAIAVLTITANMGTAELARTIANSFAEQTRALAAEQRTEQTRETLEFFRQQEKAVLDEITRQEDSLAEFRSANDLSIQGSLEFRRSELSGLIDALLELDREIIAAQLARDNVNRDGNARAATVARETEDLTRQLNSLTTQRQLLQNRRDTLSASIETTPGVERGLAEFERRIEQLQDQLDTIAARRNEAEVAFTLENASRGEKFVTLEEARAPDLPISRPRRTVAAAGAVASLMLGLVLAFLLELRRPILRTGAQMQRETGLLPVVSIPETTPSKDRKGLSRIWQDRREAGKRGRAARLARQGDMAR